MSKALRFGKAIQDNGWGMFLLFLQYKLTEARGDEEGKTTRIDTYIGTEEMGFSHVGVGIGKC